MPRWEQAKTLLDVIAAGFPSGRQEGQSQNTLGRGYPNASLILLLDFAPQPEPSQNPRIPEVALVEDRKVGANLGHTCSGCTESHSLLPALIPSPFPFPFLLLSFPPASIPVPAGTGHFACGERIPTICEAPWQLHKRKHGLEVFIQGHGI